MFRKCSVSVIVPFFNGAAWLEEALISVFMQTYQAAEVIVVDDGSREDIGALLKRHKHRILYVKQPNRGPGSARNHGIELSHGDYVAFLDSDDVWLPNKLETQVQAMQQTNAVWSHTGYETFRDQATTRAPIETVEVGTTVGMIYPRMLMTNRIATPCVMIEGNLLRSDPRLRFEESMRYGQDQALWARLALLHPIVGVDEALTRVRIRGGNASRRARAQIMARADMWRLLNDAKNGFNASELPVFTKLAFRLSALGSGLLRHLGPATRSPSTAEMLSRILYFPSWLLFKLDFALEERHANCLT